MKTVTVGIPVYNAGKYLKTAIESVLSQTYTNFELIITDDGSNDNSVEIMNSFNDPRIKVVVDGENHGLPSRLNQQVQMATGKYFVRMDADDVMFPNRIAEQIEFLEAHCDVDVVGAKSVIIDEQSRIIYQSKQGGRAPSTTLDVIEGRIFIHPTVTGKTEWFHSNPYDETKHRSQDFFLWLQSVEHSKFALIDKPMLFYRVLKKDVVNKFVRDNQLMRKFYWNEFMHSHAFSYLYNWGKQLVRLPLFYIFHACVGNSGVLKRRYQSITPDMKGYYESILDRVV